MKILKFGANATVATFLLGATLAVTQTVRDVVSFTGQNQSGNPTMTPTQGRDGKLYGTSAMLSGSGSDFSLSLGGNDLIIHTFNGTSGDAPYAGLTLGTDGNFYGTASSGGTANYGLFYRLSPQGNFTTLHNFLGLSDGSSPTSAPIEAADGNFYGTTNGNAGNPATVYKYNPSSGTVTTIYQFDQLHGTSVHNGLLQGSDGYLYGVADFGGAHGSGTVFRLSTSGQPFFFHSFTGGEGGAIPVSTLIEASDGYFYGMTELGGTAPGAGYGTVFKIDRAGHISIVYKFNPSTSAIYPAGGLIQGTDGYLYGALSENTLPGLGSIFRISLSGQYQQLYNFTATTGETVGASLLQHTNGVFYGSAETGGAYGFGAIYNLDMGLGAFITFVRPTGKVGQSAQILGQGFTGATAVTFNGKAATSFSVVNDTFMSAVVPTGATTGKVVVTTPAGKLTSNVNFRVSK